MPIANRLQTNYVSRKAAVICRLLTPRHSLPLSVIGLLSADLSHTQQFSLSILLHIMGNTHRLR